MKINKTNAVNFHGYKNVMSTTVTSPQKDFAFSCMGMQLDNVNKNDLKIWQEIQKNLLKREELDDIIVFKAMKINDETKFLIDKFILEPQNIKNLKTEKEVLKTFTLISSLTKRIKNEYFTPEDRNLYVTLVEVMKDIAKTIKDEESVFIMSKQMAYKEIPHQQTADFFHSNIQKKMIKYFKL